MYVFIFYFKLYVASAAPSMSNPTSIAGGNADKLPSISGGQDQGTAGMYVQYVCMYV